MNTAFDKQELVDKMLTAALELAARGWPVFPCKTRGKDAKRPFTPHGFKDASTDPGTIRDWWNRWPGAAIGVPTGPSIGCFVLDVDLPQGPDSLKALEALHGPLPATCTQRTGSGGFQCFFRWPESMEIRNSAGKLGPGLDVRGQGGYVLVPPSLHPSGKRYAWSSNGTPPADAPGWLVDLITRSAPEPKQEPTAKTRPATNHPGTTAYGRKVLEDEAEKVAFAEFKTRNDTLYIAACKIGHRVAGNEIDEQDAWRALLDAAARCGLTEKEARKTILSGLSKGKMETRSAPPRADQSAPAPEHSTPPRKDENQSSISFTQDPLPLPSARPAAPGLDPALCPAALRPWWLDVSERAEMPLEYCAAASLVVLSSLIGRRCAIRPRRVDDWTVIPNLWGCIVGRPGTMKSLAVELAAAPMQSLIDDANKEHQKALHHAKARKMTLEIERKELESEYRKAFKSRDDNLCKATENDLAELQAQIDEECNPKPRRYITGDSTTEKLLEMMRDNPNGMLLKRDEISGWMRSLNRSDRQGDRELYLETWSGTTPYNQDRIGRGEVFVPAMCLSVLGTTQPGKLASYVRGAIKGALEDDGFLQRFQVMVWSEPYTGPAVERKPDRDARDKAYALHHALAELDAESIGATPGTVPYLKFEQPAQDLFDAWFKDLKNLLRCPEMEPFPAFESHLAKYKSLMPSLALIFHLVDCLSHGRRGPVTLAAASLAAEWCSFLEAHAKKIYAEELGTNAEAAHVLGKKIQEGTVKDGWTIRDIYRQEWSGLNTAADTWNAINQLAALHWLVVSETGDVGRKQQVLYINPKVVKK